MTYKGYLIDLDGTIYRGSELIPAGKRFVDELQRRQLPFLFVTNNTTKTPQVVADRLKREFDIFVNPSKIYTASLATLDYMKELNLGNKVYIIGEEGLIAPILDAGYIWDETTPDYVVVGLDTNVTYEKFTIATLAIQKGATFIGTNADKNIPTESGLKPGAGSLIRFLETSTRVAPIFIGKPEAIIMEKALAQIQLQKSEVLMVGDNYETDSLSGLNNQIDSLLVLSGFTKKDEVATLPITPTYVLNSLDEWVFD